MDGMTMERVKKIEARDVIAIVGFALYLHGQFSKTTTNAALG
jgi:hypothetical protein